MSDFHTIIIGSGSGGRTVAVGLSNLGKRVALVEGGAVGGDCTNVGCVPSKTLIHLVTHGHGLSSADILAEVQRKRDRLRDEETEEVQQMNNVTFIAGWASFKDKKTLNVDLADGTRREVSADNIIIATGGQPASLAIAGLPEARALTNESVFEQADKPEHLVVIGSGIIGSELGFAFRKLGSRVSVVSRGGHVLGAMEPEVSQAVGAAMLEQGIEVYTNAEAVRYEEEAQTLIIVQDGTHVPLQGVDKVLVAIGRRPNLERLNLTAAGVAHDRKGIPTDAYSATNVRGIYAIGDVNPVSNYTHSANAQGRRLVTRLAFGWLPRFSKEPLYPSATFSDPEVASIGPTLAALHKTHHPDLITTVRCDLPKTDKGYTEGLERGFVLVHAVRLTGRVLSATVVAPKASEMISLLTSAVYHGVSLYKLSSMVYPYPTLSEGVKKAADAFVFATLPKVPRELGAYLRYRWSGPVARDVPTTPLKDAHPAR